MKGKAPSAFTQACRKDTVQCADSLGASWGRDCVRGWVLVVRVCPQSDIGGGRRVARNSVAVRSLHLCVHGWPVLRRPWPVSVGKSKLVRIPLGAPSIPLPETDLTRSIKAYCVACKSWADTPASFLWGDLGAESTRQCESRIRVALACYAPTNDILPLRRDWSALIEMEHEFAPKKTLTPHLLALSHTRKIVERISMKGFGDS